MALRAFDIDVIGKHQPASYVFFAHRRTALRRLIQIHRDFRLYWIDRPVDGVLLSIQPAGVFRKLLRIVEVADENIILTRWKQLYGAEFDGLGQRDPSSSSFKITATRVRTSGGKARSTLFWL